MQCLAFLEHSWISEMQCLAPASRKLSVLGNAWRFSARLTPCRVQCIDLQAIRRFPAFWRKLCISFRATDGNCRGPVEKISRFEVENSSLLHLIHAGHLRDIWQMLMGSLSRWIGRLLQGHCQMMRYVQCYVNCYCETFEGHLADAYGSAAQPDVE